MRCMYVVVESNVINYTSVFMFDANEIHKVCSELIDNEERRYC